MYTYVLYRVQPTRSFRTGGNRIRWLYCGTGSNAARKGVEKKTFLVLHLSCNPQSVPRMTSGQLFKETIIESWFNFKPEVCAVHCKRRG